MDIDKIKAIPLEDAFRYYNIPGNRGRYICPFHNDRKPSMTIKYNRFRCWTCDTRGDLIDFVRNLFELDVYNSLLKINNDFSLNLTDEVPKGDDMDYFIDRDRVRKALLEEAKREEEARIGL